MTHPEKLLNNGHRKLFKNSMRS